MTLAVLHPFGACSTLIIYDFPQVWTREKYISYFYNCIDKKVEHLGQWYFFNAHSFLLLSNYEKYSASILNNILKEIGFTHTVPVENSKNNTTIQLWTIPIPLFIQNITKMYQSLPISEKLK